MLFHTLIHCFHGKNLGNVKKWMKLDGWMSAHWNVQHWIDLIKITKAISLCFLIKLNTFISARLQKLVK